MLTDEKLQVLIEDHGDKAFRVWVTLLSRADEGMIDENRRILASVCQAKRDVLDAILSDMAELGMISLSDVQIIITKWADYQDCDSKDRVKKHRDRYRTVTEPLPNRYEHGTVTDRRIEGEGEGEGEEYKSARIFENTESAKEPEDTPLPLDASSPAKSSRFRPPSPGEVRLYCDERRNSIDPDAFCDFYASKGWRVGKDPMKDWQSAVRTWEKRDANKPTASPSRPEPKASVIDPGMMEIVRRHNGASA